MTPSEIYKKWFTLTQNPVPSNANVAIGRGYYDAPVAEVGSIHNKVSSDKYDYDPEGGTIKFGTAKKPPQKKRHRITTNDVFRFIEQQYGGDVSKVIGTVSTVMAVGVTSGFIKDPKIKRAITTAQGVLGAAMLGYDFYHRVQSFVRSNYSEPVELRDRRHEYISQSLGESYSTSGFLSSKNIILWILNKPETSDIRVLKYFDFNKYEEIPFIDDSHTEIGILIKFPDDRLGIWHMKIMKMGEYVNCQDSDLHVSGLCPDHEQFITYQMDINREYVSSLEIDKNTLRFNGHGTFMGLEPVPRKIVNTNIYNFNFDGFIKEIDTVLECKRRRAYAFVGQPGVGKSSIIRKVESAITKYPMVYFSATEFENSDTLRNSFQMLKSIGPCVVVIEDLDSYGLGAKNYISGTFLECIDEVNEDTTMVLLVTINETSQVHNSIINRPGRFDRIIEVTTPQSTQEIVDIMNYKINKLKDEYFAGTLPYFMHDGSPLIKDCFDRKYTQAEIVNAIAEEIILNIKTNATNLPVSDECFYYEMGQAIDNLEKSKEALARYAE